MGILDDIGKNASNEIDKMTQKTNEMVNENKAAEKEQSATSSVDKVPKEAKQDG